MHEKNIDFVRLQRFLPIAKISLFNERKDLLQHLRMVGGKKYSRKPPESQAIGAACQSNSGFVADVFSFVLTWMNKLFIFFLT